MTPREMDAKIAEWMGWTPVHWECLCDRCKKEKVKGPVDYWIMEIEGDVPDVAQIESPPNYSTSRDAMSKAEDVVRERGLTIKYLRQLWKIIPNGDGGDYDKSWYLLSATADQRAAALCRVIDQETQGD